ncbi:hypothetical protein HK102_004270 [Quaeritorhiza haematococci]|nr:hypothetical protein HK102_004270 [Quaeritorhiza haematococci]
MGNIQSAVGRSLLTTFLIDFAIQFVFYVFAAVYQTEKYYDLSGALTYFTCTLVALLYRHLPSDTSPPNSISSLSPRQIIAATFVLIWCSRLGSFLFLRIRRTKNDERFDKLKKNPFTFAIPWILQVLWILLTALPVYIILGNPTSLQPSFIWSDIVGIIIWVFGFSVEAIADYQKNAFKNKNPRDFVSTGIWSWSRYANYNGEITLWVGMMFLCAHGFVEAWQWVGIVSPVFVATLILGVSGVPLLEKSSEEKYGSRADYQAYKARTSKFFLWPPKKLPAEPSA